MNSRTDPNLFIPRPLAYTVVVCLAGIAIGLASNLMDWSAGVVYAVGLSVGTVIFLLAIRESLFTPTSELVEKRRRRHPSPR